MYIISKFNKSVNQKGSSLSLPTHGRAGARATPFLAALFAKQKTKFGGGTPVVERFAFTTGQEARAGKNFYPVGSRSDEAQNGAEKREYSSVLSLLDKIRTFFRENPDAEF